MVAAATSPQRCSGKQSRSAFLCLARTAFSFVATLTAMEKGGIEDLFKKQVPRSLYRRYNATKHVITFYNGSNLFFGHVKTDADLLQYQGAEFLFIGWEELTQFTYRQ